jgi:Zn-dependent protease with chaperone function
MIDWASTIVLFVIVSIVLTFVFVRFNLPGFLSILPWMIAIGLLFSFVTAYVLTPLALGKTTRALDPQSAARINPILHDISSRSGLRVLPKLVVVEDDSLNAMAYGSLTGPMIGVTSGLLEHFNQGSMTNDEFYAILTHEVGHIKEMHMFRETFVLSWVSIFALVGGALWSFGRSKAGATLGALAIVLLILGGVLQVLAKAVSIITYRFSRHLELRADAFSSRYFGRPSALISGLKKIQLVNGELVMKKLEQEFREMPEYADWQFTPPDASWIDKLFDTHPSIETRIANLERNKKG